jgi:hypothetical protein
MPRTLVILLTFLSLTTSALAESPAPTTPASPPLASAIHSARCSAPSSHSTGLTAFPTSASQTCCKICHTGKACGNTCISREKICHVGPGCACDG